MAAVLRCDFCSECVDAADPDEVPLGWIHTTMTVLSDEDSDDDEQETVERGWDFCSPDCLTHFAEIADAFVQGVRP